MKRVQIDIILKDLEKKIVLLVGPRQAGKTWLALEVAKHFERPVYLNYDQAQDREIMEKQAWLEDTELLILDELHKMPEWKTYLKGVFDTRPKNLRILVTGSAWLDVFDHIGDSLAGRYFRHRLMPFSVAELSKVGKKLTLNRLLERGGFPEPYLLDDVIDAQRWRSQYLSSMLSTDVFDVEVIHNLKSLRLVVSLLRNRVGSPISFKSIAEDVKISPTTVKKYIHILEALFIVFTISPFSKNIARSLSKEPKIYFYDTGLIEGYEGIRFENMVAVSLLKHVYALSDATGVSHKLQYLRTKEGQEVDFALVEEDQIKSMIEVKYSDAKPGKSLLYFHKKYNYPAVQVVKNLRNSFKSEDIKIIKADDFLKDLYL